eukprot:350345_1
MSASSRPPAMHVAVIGAGASGLAAMHCLAEAGLHPVCLEQQDYAGGMWRYSGDECLASVYKSTVINTPKETMCFSDYPMPKELATFPHNTCLFKYFQDYMDHFDLRKFIRFNHCVTRVTPAPDHKESGRWVVRYVERKYDHKTSKSSKCSQEPKIKEELFDAVCICSGHHWHPWLVDNLFPGQSDFKGKIIHSHSYKSPAKFDGQKVVVVGVGNSGVDIAVDLSRVAQETYLSTRSGTHVYSRVTEKTSRTAKNVTQFRAAKYRTLSTRSPRKACLTT